MDKVLNMLSFKIKECGVEDYARKYVEENGWVCDPHTTSCVLEPTKTFSRKRIDIFIESIVDEVKNKKNENLPKPNIFKYSCPQIVAFLEDITGLSWSCLVTAYNELYISYSSFEEMKDCVKKHISQSKRNEIMCFSDDTFKVLRKEIPEYIEFRKTQHVELMFT